MGARLATLAEMETIYSAEDVAKMAEVLMIDAHNERTLIEAQRNA